VTVTVPYAVVAAPLYTTAARTTTRSADIRRRSGRRWTHRSRATENREAGTPRARYRGPHVCRVEKSTANGKWRRTNVLFSRTVFDPCATYAKRRRRLRKLTGGRRNSGATVRTVSFAVHKFVTRSEYGGGAKAPFAFRFAARLQIINRLVDVQTTMPPRHCARDQTKRRVCPP